MRSGIIEHCRGEFVISTDPARLDLDVIHAFLTNCYWARGVPREVVALSIEHSLCFGVYDVSGEEFPSFLRKVHEKKDGATQVGFARVVSDFATVAYLGDVFVQESYRGRGLSKWMLTRDAHRLYAQYGFTPLKAPERYMELHSPDVYLKAL